MSQSTVKPFIKDKEKCLRGSVHIHTGMKLLVGLGILVILGLLTVLYFKFKKAMFILVVPTSVTLMTLAALFTNKARLVWPIIAISCFHVVLSAYVLVIFLFYFFFKPFYIIMVLNWAFDTLHNDKTLSYYVQCACIFVILLIFLSFNFWQASVSYAYHRHLVRSNRLSASDRMGSQPTVLVVNKPTEYERTQY